LFLPEVMTSLLAICGTGTRLRGADRLAHFPLAAGVAVGGVRQVLPADTSQVTAGSARSGKSPPDKDAARTWLAGPLGEAARSGARRPISASWGRRRAVRSRG
jgi:hypothetical protein